jgi:uncharacterized protein YggE
MNIPSKFWNTATVFLIVLTVAAAIGVIKLTKSIGYVGANPNNTPSIDVTGTGDAYSVPDVATFSFSVTETAKTVADAQAAATTKADAALKAVRDAGVADKDIQTQSYNINPHYDYSGALCSSGYCPPGKQVLTGYDVSETILVKVRDLSKAGDIFASIGSLGVQNVNGLDFSVDNPDAVQAEARSKAIADAQSKANLLAKQLGVSLVRVMSFSESTGGYPRPIYNMGAAKAMSVAAPQAAPDIAVGQEKVTDNVTITYEIK